MSHLLALRLEHWSLWHWMCFSLFTTCIIMPLWMNLRKGIIMRSTISSCMHFAEWANSFSSLNQIQNLFIFIFTWWFNFLLRFFFFLHPRFLFANLFLAVHLSFLFRLRLGIFLWSVFRSNKITQNYAIKDKQFLPLDGFNRNAEL